MSIAACAPLEKASSASYRLQRVERQTLAMSNCRLPLERQDCAVRRRHGERVAPPRRGEPRVGATCGTDRDRRGLDSATPPLPFGLPATLLPQLPPASEPLHHLYVDAAPTGTESRTPARANHVIAAALTLTTFSRPGNFRSRTTVGTPIPSGRASDLSLHQRKGCRKTLS